MNADEFLIVDQEEAGERLDKLLTQRFGNAYSRTYFQSLIQQHLVLLNGSPVKKRIKPEPGDEIEVQFVATPEIAVEPEAIPLDILYEDSDLIAINKPVGMVVHPALGNWTGTLVNALLSHCQSLPKGKDLRPGIVHRLDKDTSGVIIAAKNIEMQQKLVELFASREVYKEYIAVCVGNPGDSEINAPIGRHPVKRKLMAVVPNGKFALSKIKTLAWNGKLSLVSIIIATGRTHQIRVHLKYHGTPVLGDPLYGSPSSNHHYHIEHQLLHANRLRFKHPTTGEVLDLKAIPPKDMQVFMEKIDPKLKG